MMSHVQLFLQHPSIDRHFTYHLNHRLIYIIANLLVHHNTYQLTSLLIFVFDHITYPLESVLPPRDSELLDKPTNGDRFVFKIHAKP